MAAPIKLQNSTASGREFRLVPNGHTLAGFAIGAICLATTATLQSRLQLLALHKTKILFLHSNFNFLSTYLKIHLKNLDKSLEQN